VCGLTRERAAKEKNGLNKPFDKTVTRQKEKTEADPIRYLVEQRLKTRAAAEPAPSAPGEHLDEDVICAFVEARVDEAESVPIISHLVACAACRHTTAQLIRLESGFDAEPAGEILNDDPGRVSRLLERLTTGLVPSFEEEVFGYESPPEEPEAADPATDKESKEPE
jgi:hypothetical protein